MKNLVKGGLLILMIGMLSGCSGAAENTGSINTQMKEADTTAAALDDKSTKEWILPEDYHSTFRCSMGESGDMELLYFSGSRLVLYDLETEQELADCNLEEDGYFQLDLKYLAFDGENYLLYLDMCKEECIQNIQKGDDGEVQSYSTVIAPGDEKRKIIKLDSSLSVAEEWDLEQEGEVDAICASQDGTVIWISDENRIYSYDLKTLETDELESSVSSQLEGITITQMVVSDDGSRLAFLGDRINEDQYQVYGMIDTATLEVALKSTQTNYTNTLYKSGDIAYITDAADPDTGQATGQILCIDLEKKQLYKFAVDNLESTKAYLEESGTSLITGYPLDDENTGTTIHGYAFPAGGVTWEYEAPAGKLEEITAVQDQVFLTFFREDGKYYLLRIVEEG
jgi:hypothetical protein